MSIFHRLQKAKLSWMHASELCHIVIIFLIAFLSVFPLGYYYGYSDQHIYNPVIDKILDPSLYKNDLLSLQQSGSYTIFFHIMAYLSILFGLEWLYFIGFLISTFLLYYAIYKISESLFGSKWVGYIAILLCLIPKQLAGQTIGETRYLSPRTLAMPVCMIAVWLLLERKYIWTAIITAIAFQLHPLTAITPVIGIMGYIVFNFRKIGKSAAAKSILAFAIAMLPLLLKVLLSRETNMSDLSPFSRSPQDWIDVLRRRNSYAFPNEWSVARVKYAILYPLLFALGFAYESDKRRYESVWLAGASILTVLITYVFGDLFPVPLVVQFQMARGMFLITVLSLIYAAYMIYRFSSGPYIALRVAAILSGVFLVHTSDTLLRYAMVMLGVLALIDRIRYLRFLRFFGVVPFIVIAFKKSGAFSPYALMIFAALTLIVFFETVQSLFRRFEIKKWITVPVLVLTITLIYSNTLNDVFFKGLMYNRVQFPGKIPQISWIQLQKWVNENTEKDVLFLVPPNTAGFRIYAKRSSVGDNKDGGPCLFSRSYALEWSKRMKSLAGYDKLEAADFLRLAEEYKATHIVTGRRKLSFEKLYENKDYCVYKLPQPLPKDSAG